MSHSIADAVSERIVELNQTRIVELVSGFSNFELANEELHRLTGIFNFFEDRGTYDEFRSIITIPAQISLASQNREWGDFQTSPDLAWRVCRILSEANYVPRVVVEPTFGTGNFIIAMLRTFPNIERIYGVEIQEKYVWHLKLSLLIKALLSGPTSTEIELNQDDIFTHRFPKRIIKAQKLLVIGNPPWVTSSEIGSLEARNLPEKRNIKALNGMDAITGKSNFDIGELILLRMLDLFSECHEGLLAMLCKNSVAKNIVKFLPQKQYKVANIRQIEIDAGREFGVAVDASLFVMELDASNTTHICQVASLEHPEQVKREYGWIRNKFVSNVKEYESTSYMDGKSIFIWRQGVKHDCSKVMELDVKDNILMNGNGDIVDIEGGFAYWLLKSSDLRGFEASNPRKKVIITQTRLLDDTSSLEVNAPKLWSYLVKNSRDFEKRKSSIYINKPRFAIFGIGEYSFKPYKVAISGLYKQPNFSLVLPINNCPVMLDDTCYLLGFNTYIEALLTNSLLNTSTVKEFLHSIVFEDSKRPYTKETLMRIDLSQAASRMSFQTLNTFWADIGYEPIESITEGVLEEYKQSLSTRRIQWDSQLTIQMRDSK